MLDSNVELVRDPYGWGFPMALDATQAIQATLDACKNCETIDEMIQAMKDLAKNPQNRWINQILDRINSDDNLKKKFYRHFRKDALKYLHIAFLIRNQRHRKQPAFYAAEKLRISYLCFII